MRVPGKPAAVFMAGRRPWLNLLKIGDASLRKTISRRGEVLKELVGQGYAVCRLISDNLKFA
jgi:hypothetical protein